MKTAASMTEKFGEKIEIIKEHKPISANSSPGELSDHLPHLSQAFKV
jgi:hypothetical protein